MLADQIVRRHEELVIRLAARLAIDDISADEVPEILRRAARRPEPLPQ